MLKSPGTTEEAVVLNPTGTTKTYLNLGRKLSTHLLRSLEEAGVRAVEDFTHLKASYLNCGCDQGCVKLVYHWQKWHMLPYKLALATYQSYRVQSPSVLNLQR